MQHKQRQQAFSLFEMVIVLVIIALVLGAIMVARDLINNSRIRSAIGQVEQINGAVGTFRTKYNGLPGDLTVGTASTYGLTTLDQGSYTSGYGDGNGKVESAITGGLSRVDLANGEVTLFWKHLDETKMLPLGTDAVTPANGQLEAAASSDDYKKWLPTMTLRSRVFLYLYAYNVHHYYIARFDQQTGPSISTATSDGLTAWESKTLDEKLDDGYPSSGRVLAVRDMGLTAPTLDEGAEPAASVCVDNTTTPPSYYTSSILDRVNCRLNVRAAY